jgi:hypothetical protein
VAPATCRILAAALLLTTYGCSGSSPASPSTVVPATASAPAGTGASVSPHLLPRVDLIDDAVSALEEQLGAPQQYFEINATPQLVNLFVALNDGKVAQPWVYLDGELSSTEGRDANGFTFARTALDFDPGTVLSRVETELPQSEPDAFIVEAGEGGIVRYSVTVRSPQGGQLVVVVGPDGAVKSVGT